MNKQVRVNVRTNSVSKPREEMRNGRKVIVVSSATMPDDVVMNDIRYPATEIEKSFATLNRAPAPLGHPMIGGMFVSARDPEAINANHVGAWNENVRREKGRVLLDKVIDVEVANRTEAGRGLMAAINEGKPIHTSTGLVANLETAPENSGAKYFAKNIIFDHDAILLNEKGAATPEQGVGMFVNSTGETVDVVNSVLEDSAISDLEWAADMAVRAVEKLGRASLVERVATAIKKALTGEGGGTSELNNGESEMDEKKFNDLSAKVDAIADSMKGIDALVANAVAVAVKPLTDNLTAITAANAAKDAAELTELRAKIVKANLMSESTAGELTLNTARELAKKAEPGKAAAVMGAFHNSSGESDEFAGVDLNAAMTTGGK
jgi:hypothetical protein